MTKECVHCGYCCSKAPCSYGKIDKEGRCLFLIDEDKELCTFYCCVKKEIELRESTPEYSMFGCGCSSPLFNTIREAVVEKLNERSRKQNLKQSKLRQDA